MRIAQRVESKSVLISMLRNQALLRDIWEAEHGVITAIQYINFFSTEFRRFDACCLRRSGGAAACARQVTFSCS